MCASERSEGVCVLVRGCVHINTRLCSFTEGSGHVIVLIGHGFTEAHDWRAKQIELLLECPFL